MPGADQVSEETSGREWDAEEDTEKAITFLSPCVFFIFRRVSKAFKAVGLAEPGHVCSGWTTNIVLLLLGGNIFNRSGGDDRAT